MNTVKAFKQHSTVASSELKYPLQTIISYTENTLEIKRLRCKGHTLLKLQENNYSKLKTSLKCTKPP